MTNASVILLENEVCLQVYPGVDLTIQWVNTTKNYNTFDP